LEFESTIKDGQHYVTGVIEITSDTAAKYECFKDVPFNPIMQDTVINKNT